MAFVSENVEIEERYIFANDGWNGETFLEKRTDGVRSIESHERTCVENNDGRREVALGGSRL